MNILIAGDYSPIYRVANLIELGKYEEIFSNDLLQNIRSADYSIVNFESSIVEDSFKPIKKCGPNLKSTSKAILAIQYAGFKAVTLANNHIMDYGIEGLKYTIECCKNASIDTVGVGDNLNEAENILYVKQNDNTLAIINCCEHEFSIASETQSGANPLNPIMQYYAINEARKNSDYVLVIVHGGHEYYQLPSSRMQDTYRFFVDAGADAVVNHHQHCYSGYEIYKGKPIFYGLGNFCFDKKRILADDMWNYGYMLFLSLSKSGVSYNILPYEQCRETPSIKMLSSVSFDSRLKELNEIIADKDKLNEETIKYYSECSQSIRSLLEPIHNRYLNAAQRRHLFPSFLSEKRLLKIQNYVLCEAHRDKMNYFFNHNK